MSTIRWILGRRGAVGLTLLAFGLSCNSTPENKPPVTGCTIDGTDYADNAVNPDDPCQSCQLSVSATSWSNLMDGLKCNQGNSVCTSGACRSGCYIGMKFYAAPSLEPTNSCKVCRPAQSTTDWSDLPVGTSCADGGVCTGTVCQVGCYILGQVYPDRSSNPGDISQCCNQRGAPSDWSSRLLSPVTYDLGGTGADIVAADLNGDGKPDLIVKSAGQKSIDVLLNQGGGVFAAQVVYPAGTGVPGSMTAGDLDGDGKIDLICSEYEDGIMLFPGLGNGALAAGLPVVDAGEGTIASADLNQDQVLDLLSSDPDGGQLGLFGGIGDGGVISAYYPPASGPQQVFIADVNGDGLPDLIFSTKVDVQVFIAQSGGRFNVPIIFTAATPPGGFGFGDLTGSGTGTLLISSGGVGQLASTPLPDGGTATSVANIVSVSGTTERMAVGDFNGDHAPDVAVLSGTGILVFLNGCP